MSRHAQLFRAEDYVSQLSVFCQHYDIEIELLPLYVLMIQESLPTWITE